MTKKASILCAFLTICLGLNSVYSEEAPSWGYEWQEHPEASLSAVKWHKKDYGWLMTGRFGTPSKFGIRPITHLRFEAIRMEPSEEEPAEGEEVEEVEVVVWEDSKIIRRKDLDSSLTGQDEIFVRMLIKDLPADFDFMRVSFDGGGSGSEE